MTQDTPEGPFSANLFYDRAIARDRLYRARTRRPMAACGRAARHRRGGSLPARRRAMRPASASHLFTIPPGSPFLPTLVDALFDGRLVGPLSDDPAALADITIYVPTRRATRALIALLAERGRRESAAPAAHRASGRSGRGRVRADGTRRHAARGSRIAETADPAAGTPADPDAADPALVGAGRPHAAATRARCALSRARVRPPMRSISRPISRR